MVRKPIVGVAGLVAGLVAPVSAAPQEPGDPVGVANPAGAITDVPGIRVGQYTYPGANTGCTVVIADGGAVGGVDVRGGAPGTVETDLLDPVNTVQQVNAVVLSGGSAFGLAARQGVVRHLEERGEGYRVGGGLVVPIVPGAIIFDLRVAGGVRPGPDCGYRAATGASSGAVAEGSVGAGAGATVGKMRGGGGAMKGGVGTASIALGSGLVVAAIVVVNAVGDIIDPATGEVVAGARGDNNELLDARRILRGLVPPQPPGGPPGAAPATRSGTAPATPLDPQPGENTTIGIVATNARLTKAEATKVAQMAHDGFARAIVPAHTPGDGDTIFSLATGTLAEGFSTSQVGALAAEAMADAILQAVREAHGLPSIPAVRDLAGS